MIKDPKEITVRVTRAFYLGGEVVPVDTVLPLETTQARELITYGKAVETQEKPRGPRKQAEPVKSKPEAKADAAPKSEPKVAPKAEPSKEGDKQ